MTGLGPIPRAEKAGLFQREWEKKIFGLTLGTIAQGLYNIDENRYARECMEPGAYLASSYYAQWFAALETNLVDRGVIDRAKFDDRTRSFADGRGVAAAPRAKPELMDALRSAIYEGVPPQRSVDQSHASPSGRVRTSNVHPRGHTRLPATSAVASASSSAYARRARSPTRSALPRRRTATRVHRPLRHTRALGRVGRAEHVARLRRLGGVPRAGARGREEGVTRWSRTTRARPRRPPVATRPPMRSWMHRRGALEAILIENGLLGTETVDEVVEIYEHDIGPLLGAKVIARAWTDEAFKRRLVADATAACRELGIGGLQGESLICVENTPQLHNVMVCTLCSCYPWPVLGVPPAFYKSPQYRARVVVEPRKVLADDFGLVVPPEMEVRVYDVTAEERYFVLPQLPPGTEGMTEDSSPRSSPATP